MCWSSESMIWSSIVKLSALRAARLWSHLHIRGSWTMHCRLCSWEPFLSWARNAGLFFWNYKSCFRCFGVTLKTCQIIITNSRRLNRLLIPSFFVSESSKWNRLSMCFTCISNILIWKITNECIQTTLFWEPRLISYRGFWTLFSHFKLSLSNAVVTNTWTLKVIGLFKDHCCFTVHTLSIGITSLLNIAESHIVIWISSSPTCSTPTPLPWVSTWSPMSLRSTKRILRTSFDSCLGNILFSDHSLNLVISRTWCNVSLWLLLVSLKLLSRNLELTRKHHNCVSLVPSSTLVVVPGILIVHLIEKHLLSLIYDIFRRLAFWEAWSSSHVLGTSLSADCL